MKTLHATIACLGGLLLGSVHAQTVMVPASLDNTLFESATGSLSNGVGPRGYFGATAGGNIRRYLVQFDVASMVPAGATITGVTFQINLMGISPGSLPNPTQDLHRVTQAWGEGTSNAGVPGGQGSPATAGDATWIHTYFPGSNWTIPGGDFDLTPSATFSINSFGVLSLSGASMLPDVQDWLDNPTSNFGWVLKDRNEGPSSAKFLGSRESTATNGTPMLVVDYQMGGPIYTPFCDPADLNSTGFPTVLTGVIMSSPPGTGLHLEATQGPPGQFGYFVVGTAFAEPGIPIGQGHLCVSGAIGRYNVAGGSLNSTSFFNAAGVLQNNVGTSSVGTGFDVPNTVPISGSPMIMGGETWHFQLWHRENGGTSNFSNGFSVTF